MMDARSLSWCQFLSLTVIEAQSSSSVHRYTQSTRRVHSGSTSELPLLSFPPTSSSLFPSFHFASLSLFLSFSSPSLSFSLLLLPLYLFLIYFAFVFARPGGKAACGSPPSNITTKNITSNSISSDPPHHNASNINDRSCPMFCACGRVWFSLVRKGGGEKKGTLHVRCTRTNAPNPHHGIPFLWLVRIEK